MTVYYSARPASGSFTEMASGQVFDPEAAFSSETAPTATKELGKGHFSRADNSVEGGHSKNKNHARMHTLFRNRIIQQFLHGLQLLRFPSCLLGYIDRNSG